MYCLDIRDFFAILFNVSIASPPDRQAGGPRIKFTEESFDFGRIPEDNIVEHTFTFTNTGDEPLQIKDSQSSCGCTTVLVSKDVINPGETGEIKTSLNPVGKRGKITKTITVTTNDPVAPQKTLSIYADVTSAGHPMVGLEDTLFKGECAACHVEKGIGKKGKELYLADCAMCHGEDGEGKSAPILNRQEYLRSKNDRYIREWVANGKKGSGMPGHSKEKGGPLDNSQIDSLVAYIRQWEKASKPSLDITRIKGEFIILADKPFSHKQGKVKMLVFFDFFCPHCYTLYKEIPALKKKHGDKLEIVEVGVPLWQKSLLPLEAYEIAKDQGKGKEMEALLFHTIHEKKINADDPIILKGLAAELDLDTVAFENQLKKRTKFQILVANSELGEKYKIEGTPMVIFDDQIKAKGNSIKNFDTIISSLMRY